MLEACLVFARDPSFQAVLERQLLRMYGTLLDLQGQPRFNTFMEVLTVQLFIQLVRVQGYPVVMDMSPASLDLTS